jgi:hypothetical protein
VTTSSRIRTRPPRRIDHRPLLLQVDLGDDLLDERDHHLTAVGPLDDEQILRRQMADLGDPADLRAVREHHVQVHQLVVVVLVGLLRQFLRVHLGDEQGVAQRLRRGAVGHALEAQQQTSAVHPAGLDGQRPDGGRVGGQHGAGPEPQLRLVRAHLDGDLALDAMGPADPRHYQLHLNVSFDTTTGRGGPTALPGPSRRI